MFNLGKIYKEPFEDETGERKNELMGCDERATAHISQVFWVNSGAVGGGGGGLRLQTCVQRTQKRSNNGRSLKRFGE